MSSKDRGNIAVIDFGKTNKKILLFSPELKILCKEVANIEEVEAGGILSDNIPEAMNWIYGALKKLASKYPIASITATTFGATASYLDRNKESVFAVPSYMNLPDDAIRLRFLEEYGSAEDLYLCSGSPFQNYILNIGYGIYWLRERFPEKWRRVRHILFLPQYVAYLLSGSMTAELTSAGCHTMLWDLEENGWSQLAQKMGVPGMFPLHMSDPWSLAGLIRPELAEMTGIDPGCRISAGIHDSNASLMPYLLACSTDFVLASTGTWCAVMCPRSEFHLDPADMTKDTQYYIGPFGKPVRAAKFMAGGEHDHYSNKIRERLGGNPLNTRFDPEIIHSIIKEQDCFLVPTLYKGVGLFPDSEGRIVNKEKFYSSANYAYHVLCLSLAIQTLFAIKQATGKKEHALPVFIEGGFRNNEVYMSLVAGLLDDREVFSTNIEEATAYGAAICGKCCAEEIHPGRLDQELFRIERIKMEAPSLDQQELTEYIDCFVDLCGE